MPHAHKDVGPDEVTCAILTVSSTRTLETDEGGPAVASALAQQDHDLAPRALVADDLDEIRRAIAELVRETDAVFVTGGTGPARDDVTPEAVLDLAVKQLPGFGEAFRRRSEEEVGAAAMFSRALAVVAEVDGDRAPVFCLPGSPEGAAMGAALVAGQLGHLVGLVRSQEG